MARLKKSNETKQKLIHKIKNENNDTNANRLSFWFWSSGGDYVNNLFQQCDTKTTSETKN